MLEAEAYHLNPTSQVLTDRHGRPVRTYVFMRGSSDYDTKEMSVLVDGLVQEAQALGIETLTPREFEVLVFLLRNQDIVITREQLLHNIWGFNFAGESRSVDIHVQQVRRKLSLQSSLITVPKIGYRLDALNDTKG